MGGMKRQAIVVAVIVTGCVVVSSAQQQPRGGQSPRSRSRRSPLPTRSPPRPAGSRTGTSRRRCRSRSPGCRGRRSPGPGTRPSTSTSTPRTSPRTRPTRSWSRCSIAPAWVPSPTWTAEPGRTWTPLLKAGAPYKDRVANFITFSADGINEPGWSEKFAAEMERAFKAGALGMKVWKTRRPDREEPRRHVHPGRRSTPRSDLGDGREVRPAGDDPHQRLDRPLLPDQPEERALRGRPVGQARRHRGQLLQERLPDLRRDRAGAREHAPQASEDALRQRAHGDALLRPGQGREAARHLPERRRRDLGDGAGSRAGAAAVARVHHQVPGPRAVRLGRRPGARRRRLLDAALALPRDLRRVLRAPGADADRGRLTRARPLEHLGHRPARRGAAQGLLRERAAPPAVAEGVDHSAGGRADA